MARFTTLPSLSTMTATVQAMAHVRAAITLLQRSPINGDNDIYARLDRVAIALREINPEIGNAAYSPAETAKLTTTAVAEFNKPAPGIDVPAVKTAVTAPPTITTATGTNDIAHADALFLAFLLTAVRATGKQCREWGATKEQMLRLEGMGKIVNVGKGNRPAFKVAVADHSDCCLPGDLAPHDAHVTLFAMQPADKPTAPSKAKKTRKVKAAPATAPVTTTDDAIPFDGPVETPPVTASPAEAFATAVASADDDTKREFIEALIATSGTLAPVNTLADITTDALMQEIGRRLSALSLPKAHADQAGGCWATLASYLASK